MKEIINSNFNKYYPEIKNAIKKASFIAVDAEFTGIQSKEIEKYRLLDSLDVRYKKLKDNIKPFVIIQCGIATFWQVPEKNIYTSKCFNFYLLPRSVPFKNRQFSWQVASLEFLSSYNFNFNKFMNDGICYLNEIDEILLKEHIDNGNLIYNPKHLTFNEENDFKECRTKVSKWLTECPNNVSFSVKTRSPIVKYMIHKDLRNSFPNIWTVSKHSFIIIMRVSQNLRKYLEEQEAMALEEELYDFYIGFSKVFKLLTSLKTPIIGHNILLDLMFVHQQFYKPLPNKYSTFKSNIHTLFPKIYDTKFISFELQKIDKEALWKLNTLKDIYEYFIRGKGKLLASGSPLIGSYETALDDEDYHNAGWDAYFAGFIFIKMAYIFAVHEYGECLERRPVTHCELMNSVQNFINSINISRGNELCIKLDGNDSVIKKPQWLHVKLNSPYLNAKEIAKRFSNFGHVDVMPFTKRRLLVAVATQKSALDIVQYFKDDTDIQVTWYNPIIHVSPKRILLWSGFVLTGGILAWVIQLIYKEFV